MNVDCAKTKKVEKKVEENQVFFVTLLAVGSISSRFVSPRSLPLTTAGSLVYTLCFLTTAKPARIEQASLWLVNSAARLSNMADVSDDQFLSAAWENKDLKFLLSRTYSGRAPWNRSVSHPESTQIMFTIKIVRRSTCNFINMNTAELWTEKQRKVTD